MKIIKRFLLGILLVITFNQAAFAYGDTDSLDDTCTEGIGILNRIVADITTLGLFSAYSDSFYIDGANGKGDPNGCDANYYPVNGSGDAQFHAPTSEPAYDAEGNPLAACESDGGMKICYNQWVINASCPVGCYQYDCNWVDAKGWGPKWYWAPPGTIVVVKNGDKICAQFDTSVGYQSIGCKYIPKCEQFALKKDCFVAESCISKNAQKSWAILPISGAIIQCVTESVNKLFIQDEGCESDGNYTVSAFPQFQAGMRNAVRSCLMLYIILYGLRIVLGAEVPSKGEMFKFGAKFVLVMYFSTGINTSAANEQAVYSDGITTYMKPLFMNGAASLANMVYSAGGSEGLCVYKESYYEDGYSYLSLWDSIDCRILYYLGIDMSKVAGDTINSSDLQPLLLSLIVPGFLSFQLIFVVFAIVFFVFFISIVVYFVNITVISIILLAILIYLAPIFVPMVLFEATKGYYEGWLKLTASYALQPMVVAVYVAMMMTIYDQTVFGDCRFIESKKELMDSKGFSKKDMPFFTLCDPSSNNSACTTSAQSCTEGDENCTIDDNITKCEDTVGYILNPLESSDADFTNTVDAIFFKMPILKSNVVSDMLSGLVTLCLFGYLFFKFGDMLSEFAAELTGGPGIGNAAGDPMALVKSAGQTVMNMGKAAMQGGDKGSGAEVTKEPGDKNRSNATSSRESDGKSSGAQVNKET